LQLWILGNPIKVEGAEHLNTRGIFICNHASPLDIFLVMWLAPTGTVGIAKKEVRTQHTHKKAASVSLNNKSLPR
jgi:1-acyl-sn-glycerol-3-phosphate acyltransferase